jgi:hypothetical protein
MLRTPNRTELVSLGFASCFVSYCINLLIRFCICRQFQQQICTLHPALSLVQNEPSWQTGVSLLERTAKETETRRGPAHGEADGSEEFKIKSEELAEGGKRVFWRRKCWFSA